MFELRRIGFVKRASAWLLDAILLAVLTTGIMYLVSLIAGFGRQQELLKSYFDAWDEYRIEYLADIAPHYGYKYTVDEEDEKKYELVKTESGEEADFFDVLRDMDKTPPEAGSDETLIRAYEAYLDLCGVDENHVIVREDGIPPVRIDAQYNYVIALLFMMLSIGLLLSYLILEFILPILLKNGQTVGKKVFSIGLVRPNCVRATALALFARTMVGKFAFETMFPVLLIYMFLFGRLGILALILLAALLLLNIILFFATKNRTPIHDLLAGTVAVDMKLQMIYYSEDELNEAKALLHREEVESSRS